MKKVLVLLAGLLIIAGAGLALAGLAEIRGFTNGTGLASRSGAEGDGPGGGVPAGFRGPGRTGCACCGTQNPDAAGTTGTARLSEGIQEAYIEVNGGYIPETLTVKAGVPLRLTFSKGTSSCDSIIVLPFINQQIDVSAGEQTVEIPALAPGTYEYYCGMKMLYGRIVAE